MKKRTILTGVSSFLAVLGVTMLLAGNTASALAPAAPPATSTQVQSLVHQQFHATGNVTFFDTNITTPPQVGQFFTLEEVLTDSNQAVIGTDHIECTVKAVTQTDMRFKCKATFTFPEGAVNAFTEFSFPFDPTQLPIQYNAGILGGTGAYRHAIGVVHVTDSGPLTPTEYDFNFVAF